MDLQPAGWRLTGGSDPRASLDQRRARSLLAEDLDVLEELADGYTGPLKLQLTGPWTLAATVERPRGDKVLADHGARRDLAEVLALGLGDHVAEVRRRVPGAELVVQIDEPGVARRTGWGRPDGVRMGQAPFGRRSGRCGAPEPGDDRSAHVIHCCAARPPIEVFTKSGATGRRRRHLSARQSRLGSDRPRRRGRHHPLRRPGADHRRCCPTQSRPPNPLIRRWRELGLDPELLKKVVITPACGLAASPSPADARARLDLLRRVVDAVRPKPQSA